MTEQDQQALPPSPEDADSKTERSADAGQSPAHIPAANPPPRGPRARVLIALAVVGLAGLLAGVTWHSQLSGIIDKIHFLGAQTQPVKAESGKTQWYQCGMHPWVILPKPGQCPICHMDLTPIDAGKFSAETATHPAEVDISPVISQDIGIRVTRVSSGPVISVIRAVGSVDYDETRVRDINLKIGGWVSKLNVDSVGKPVDVGDALLEIYSPDLYTAQEEYLNVFKSHASPTTQTGNSSQLNQWDGELLASARKRLENFDISPQQITALEQSGKSRKAMQITSPYRGLVTVKNVYEGMKVDSGTQLYRIADLSKVWIMVTLFEYQLSSVTLGQEAEVTLANMPQKTFKGKITYIYPYLNQDSRQAKVRLEFENRHAAAGSSDWLLKPGMFADVELRSEIAKEGTLVPREAVIDTGTRKLVFVSLGEGRFDPREVIVGPVEAQDGMVQVLKGLKPRDLVVTSGNFLLDSDSNMKSAIAKMRASELAAEQEPTTTPAGTSEPASTPQATIPQESQQQVDRVIGAYLEVAQLLAANKTNGVKEHMATMTQGAKALGAQQSLKQIADGIAGAASRKTSSPAELRAAFKTLSTHIIELVRLAPPSSTVAAELYVMHCPMVNADWVQRTRDVANPYDTAMAGCGNITATVKAAPAEK